LKSIERFIRQKIIKRGKKKTREDKCFQINTKFTEKYPDYNIGVGTYGMPLVHDWNEGTTLDIGSYGSIASNVQIFLGGHHRVDWVTTFPFPAFLSEHEDITDYSVTSGDVNIGSDVWLCSNSIILSGVSIGHGAVVANAAIVTKNVEPYSIVGGNPAVHLKYRFSAPIRERLLAVEWWNFPHEILANNMDKICSSDIETFLTFAENFKKN
jgi:acetyltransferase-like isoleucine patch superfamily enzyme